MWERTPKGRGSEVVHARLKRRHTVLSNITDEMAAKLNALAMRIFTCSIAEQAGDHRSAALIRSTLHDDLDALVDYLINEAKK